MGMVVVTSMKMTTTTRMVCWMQMIPALLETWDGHQIRVQMLMAMVAVIREKTLMMMAIRCPMLVILVLVVSLDGNRPLHSMWMETVVEIQMKIQMTTMTGSTMVQTCALGRHKVSRCTKEVVHMSKATMMETAFSMV